MNRTLDQIRAQVAFDGAKQIKEKLKSSDFELFKSYIKSMPALIHNDGLMQTVAFYQSKHTAAYDRILDLVKKWLFHGQCPHRLVGDHNRDLIEALMKLNSLQYRTTTNEVQRFVYWIKRLADAM